MKLSPGQKLMVQDGFPAVLFATPAQRAADWVKNPPKPLPRIEFNRQRTPDDEATAAFRAQEEERRRAQSRAKIERMKLRMASKEIDHSKMRWDARRAKFVPIGPWAVKPASLPAAVRVPVGSTPRVAASAPIRQSAGSEDWSRVNKDNAEAIAKLNGVWKDSYEKLRGTGRIVMTVCNVLKGKVKRGEGVIWQ